MHPDEEDSDAESCVSVSVSFRLDSRPPAELAAAGDTVQQPAAAAVAPSSPAAAAQPEAAAANAAGTPEPVAEPVAAPQSAANAASDAGSGGDADTAAPPCTAAQNASTADEPIEGSIASEPNSAAPELADSKGTAESPAVPGGAGPGALNAAEDLKPTAVAQQSGTQASPQQQPPESQHSQQAAADTGEPVAPETASERSAAPQHVAGAHLSNAEDMVTTIGPASERPPGPADQPAPPPAEAKSAAAAADPDAAAAAEPGLAEDADTDEAQFGADPLSGTDPDDDTAPASDAGSDQRPASPGYSVASTQPWPPSQTPSPFDGSEEAVTASDDDTASQPAKQQDAGEPPADGQSKTPLPQTPPLESRKPRAGSKTPQSAAAASASEQRDRPKQAFSIHCSQDRESQPYQQTHPCAPERFTRSRPPARKPAPAPPRVLTEKERQQEAAAAAERMAQQALRVAQRERERELQRMREQVLRQQAAREAERSVIARCALRPSTADGAKCQTGDDDRRIRDDESYVHLACSEGCNMSYHHPVCYHRLVDALKQQRPGFKGFKGKDDVACLTDMCTGTLIVASLHKVSAEGGAEPPQAWIERQKAAKAQRCTLPVDAPKAHGKHGRFGGDASAERKDVHRQGSPGSPRKEEPAWRRQQQQQAQQQLQAQRRRQEQQEAEEQPELTPKLGKPEPVDIPLPEDLDARLRELVREEEPSEFAVRRRKADVQPPANAAAQAARVKRRKKAMMRMRLDVFVSAQPEEEQEAGFHSGSQAWGRQPAWAQPQDDRFLPPPASAAEAAGLATAAFPSLQQAVQGGGQGQAMIILAALRQLQQGSRWGESTPVLLLECLDVHGVAYELGAANAEAALEDQLRAVFEQYGDLQQLRLFVDQEAAALEFSEAGAANRAKMHEDGRQLGRKPMRASHLTKYPTDAVIDATIQAQLEAEIEAEEAAARASGHLPSRGSHAPAWSFSEDRPQEADYRSFQSGGELLPPRSSSGNGQLTVPAPEFRPSGRIGSVDAPEFVPGAGSWRSGSIGSANAAEAMPSWAAGNTAFAAPTLPSSLELPGGIVSSPTETPPTGGDGFGGSDFGGGGGAFGGFGRENPAELIAQMERDEAMARAMAEEDGLLARKLQEQEDERMARDLAGESSGPPRPRLPPRSETWAAGAAGAAEEQDPFAAFAEQQLPPSPPPRVVTPPPAFAAEEVGSPLGPDAWGYDSPTAAAAPAAPPADDIWGSSGGSGVQPDAAFADAWGSSPAAPPPQLPLEQPPSQPQQQPAPASIGACDAAGAFSPAASEQTHFQEAAPGVEDEGEDSDDPYGWLMGGDSGAGAASSAPAAPAPASAPPAGASTARSSNAAIGGAASGGHGSGAQAYNPMGGGGSGGVGAAKAVYNPGDYRPPAIAAAAPAAAAPAAPAPAPPVEERFLCRLCRAHKAAFVCKPCLHFGPCSSCVPLGTPGVGNYRVCLQVFLLCDLSI